MVATIDLTGWQMQTAQMEVTVDYQCMECGSVWSSLAAADGCATIDAAADRAARQQRGARVDNGITRIAD